MSNIQKYPGNLFSRVGKIVGLSQYDPQPTSLRQWHSAYKQIFCSLSFFSLSEDLDLINYKPIAVPNLLFGEKNPFFFHFRCNILPKNRIKKCLSSFSLQTFPSICASATGSRLSMEERTHNSETPA